MDRSRQQQVSAGWVAPAADAVAAPVSPPLPTRLPGRASALAELVLLVAVLLALGWLWRGMQAPGFEGAAAERYQDDLALRPGPLAPAQADPAALCASPDLSAPVLDKWRDLCPRAASASADIGNLPSAMAHDLQALQAAILAGEASRSGGLSAAAASLGEGVLPPAERSRLQRQSQALQNYRERLQLVASTDGAASDGEVGPGALPLTCAWRELRARADTAASGGPLRGRWTAAQARLVADANTLALVRGQSHRLAWEVAPGAAAWSAGTAAACRALGDAQAVVSDAADLARRVLRGAQWARKAEATQRLLDHAPWLLAGWSVLAWVLVKAARRSQQPAQHIGRALLAWSLAAIPLWWWQPVAPTTLAWVTWPLAPALGALCLVLAPRLQRWVLLAPTPRLYSLSPLSLPLLVGFVGLGWWLVVDLSVHGYLRNRYLALDQTVSVFWALVVVSVAPVLAPGLANLGQRIASRLTLAPVQPSVQTGGAAPARRWPKPQIGAALRLVLVFALPLAFALLLPGNLRQVSGDVLRWAMLPVMAWFLLIRGERWASGRVGGWRRLFWSTAPLLAYIFGTLAALAVTDDHGPILVTFFTAAVFFGALVSQAMLSNGRRWLTAALAGLLVATTVAGALALALVTLPPKLSPVMPFWQERVARIAERSEAMTDPFSAENDQQAMVNWFRRHIPASGYGLGGVPWCGNQADARCNGMPAQTQSDYSFTALQGVVGQAAGLALLLVYLVPWLGLLALRQARATNGRLGAQPKHTAAALLAWLAVCWVSMVVVQTLVTTTGNLGLLPLTGVTWPFVSHGMTSLLGSTAYLGLVMHGMETD